MKIWDVHVAINYVNIVDLVIKVTAINLIFVGLLGDGGVIVDDGVCSDHFAHHIEQ